MLRLAIFSLTLLLTTAPLSAQEPETRPSFFPALEAIEHGMLKVSERHTIYWERSGNPDGIPVFVLHGGPGVGSSPTMRRFFDPAVYHIIQLDQRGCGKSKPHMEWRENTTWDLVEDLRRLKKHLKIQRKVVLQGISWGTTLALAYAEKHPEEVAGLILGAVYTGRAREVHHLYHGARAFYPEAHDRLREVIPNPEDKDWAGQLHKVITGEDRERATKAIKAFALYEVGMVSVRMTAERAAAVVAREPIDAFALLENWYTTNKFWLEEGQLLRDLDKLGTMPVFVANGRLDTITPPSTAIAVANGVKNSRLRIVPGAGHNDTPVFLEMIAGAAWVASQIGQTKGG